MNEQLQQAITKMIEKALSGLDAGAEFLAGEIPDVVMQLMMWHGVYNLLMMVIGIALVILWCVVESKIYKHMVANDADHQDWVFSILIGLIPRCVAGGVCYSLINLEWLKIWIAPKVWLIEYAASLVK